jgi:hypothetical protein
VVLLHRGTRSEHVCDIVNGMTRVHVGSQIRVSPLWTAAASLSAHLP